MSPNAAEHSLPAGWVGFRSEPDPYRKEQPGRWYASAPYLAYRVPGQRQGACLEQTVYADTYEELYAAVACQVQLYAKLTDGVRAA